MDRYTNNMEYEFHEERCANEVEYKYERKADQEGGVKLSYVEAIACLSTTGKVESIDVTSTHVGVDKLIANPNLGQIQQLSVQ